MSKVIIKNRDRANINNIESGESILVQVSKEIFLDMFKKKVLIGNIKECKDWSTTINGKHYVGDGSWKKYQILLRSVNS